MIFDITWKEFLHKSFAFILSAFCITLFSRTLKKLLKKFLQTKKRFNETALLNGKTSIFGQLSKEGSGVQFL